MDEYDKNIESGDKNWLTIERVMLVIILLLQSVILVWLWKEHNIKTAGGQIHGISRSEVPHPEIQRYMERDVTAFPAVMANHDRRVASAFAQLQETSRMIDQMDSMFESFIGDSGHMGTLMNLDDGWNALMASPTMDMREHDKNYVVVFSLPGVKRSDVAVTLEGRMLTVITSVYGGRGTGHAGTFEQSIQLPGPVGDANLAQATLTNGILRVSIPKGTTVEIAGKSQRLL